MKSCVKTYCRRATKEVTLVTEFFLVVLAAASEVSPLSVVSISSSCRSLEAESPSCSRS